MINHPLFIGPLAFVAGSALGILLGLGFASILIGMALETLAFTFVLAPVLLKREDPR